MINDSLIEMDLLENSFLEESEEVETEIKIPAVEVNADPAHEAEPDEVPPVDINTVEDKFEEDIESKGADHIIAMKQDPHNVPVVRDVEEGRYYIAASDLAMYMEYTLTEDPTEAMNDIAEAMVEEGANVTPENLYVVGAVGEMAERLNECGVLLEISASDWSVGKFESKLQIFVNKMIKKAKKNPNATAESYDKEIAKLKKVIDNIDTELNLSDDELKKKKPMSMINFLLSVTFKMLPMYVAGVPALTAGVAGMAKLTFKNYKDAAFKDLFKFLLPAGYKGAAVGTAYGLGINALVFAVADYRSVLGNQKEFVNKLIADLEADKKKALAKEGK